VVSVRFVLTQAEFVTATRGYLLRQRKLMVLVGLSVVFLVIAIATGQSFAIAAFVTLVVFEALLIVLLPVVLWRKVRAIADNELTYEFGPENIDMTAGGELHSTVPWSYIASVRRMGDVYVLVTATRQQIIVPRRAFDPPADEQTFDDLVAAHVQA
jgi:hypothetical protein